MCRWCRARDCLALVPVFFMALTVDANRATLVVRRIYACRDSRRREVDIAMPRDVRVATAQFTQVETIADDLDVCAHDHHQDATPQGQAAERLLRAVAPEIDTVEVIELSDDITVVKSAHRLILTRRSCSFD